MKKLCAIFLAAALLAGVPAGCAAKSGGLTDPGVPAEPGETAASEAAGGEKQVLKLMSVGTSSEQAYLDAFTDAVNAFNKSNPYQVELQVEWYENEAYTAKLTTLMTQNDVPDIFFGWGSGYLQPYVEAGRLLSLSPYMEEDPDWAGRFYDGTLSATTYGGEVYAVPSSQTVAVVYYNRAIFDELGLHVPATWEEFESVCAALRENGIAPIAMGGSASWVVSYFMGMLQGGISGSEAFNGLFDGTSSWSDVYLEPFQAYQELAGKEVFEDSYLGISYDEARESFLSGGAAMYPMGSWDTSAVLAGFGGDEAAVGAFFLPSKRDRLPTCTVAQTDKIYAVSANCKHPDAAVAFLKTLSAPAYQGRLVLDTGALPVSEADTSDGTVDGITQQILDAMPAVSTVLPADAFGSPLTEEIFNVCVAVAGGEDPASQAAYLQDFADALQ